MTDQEFKNMEHEIFANLRFRNMLSIEFLIASYADAKRTKPMLIRPYPGMRTTLFEHFEARLAYAATSLQFI